MGKNGLISRRALLNEFYRLIKLNTKSPSKITIAKAISTIEIAPTVEAVPVVRCKDCAHYQLIDGGKPLCGYHCRATFRDDFCSMGAKMCAEKGAKHE